MRQSLPPISRARHPVAANVSRAAAQPRYSALVLLLLCLPLAAQTHTAVSPRDQRAARDSYVAGAKLLAADHLPEAIAAFDRAATLDPNTPDYRTAGRLATEHRASELVQASAKARLLGREKEADTLLAQARALDPDNDIVRQHDLAPAQPISLEPTVSLGRTATDDLAGPLQLNPNNSRQSFKINADLRTVVTQVFTSFGIRPVFDDSVAPAATPQGVRFELENTTYAEAVPILLSMGRLFLVPLDSSSVLVATDSTANRSRLEHLYQETLYTPGLTPQQIGDVTNVIRQVFNVKQLSMQNTAGNITLRAPGSTLDALNRTLADLLGGTAEVSLDLKLYSVDLTRRRDIGPTLPQQFGVYNVAGAAQQLVTANQSTIDQAIAQGVLVIPAGANSTTRLAYEAAFLLASGLAQSSILSQTLGYFGGGISLTGVTVGNAGFQLALNSSDVRALDAIILRTGDRQSAVFRAGSRYPITTSTYQTGLSGTSAAALAGATVNGVPVSNLLNQYLGGNAAGTTIPQIQYEDLGITLKTTPNVQASGNITMHVELKIEALAGSALNNIPILASRQFASDVTVEEGQTAIMVSSLSRTESGAVNGTPGLGELPGFQSLGADRLAQRDSSEIVLLITPHLARRRANLSVGPRIPISPSSDSSE